MTKIRVLIFMTSVAVISTFLYFASLYARGYRFDSKVRWFTPRGILVVKSDPDGAQITLDGEQKLVTNSTIPLPKGGYVVEIKKEGYHPWKKQMEVSEEIVTSADAFLFKLIPSISPITYSEAQNPISSPDQTKIAFIVPGTPENIENEKDGLWIMETTNLPIGFSRDPKRITNGDLEESTIQFSPDGRQILLTTKTSAYLFDTSVFTPALKRINIKTTLETTLSQWKNEEEVKLKAKLKSLPKEMADILENSADNVEFSPDETKILFRAILDTTIPDNIVKPLPGSSTQPQERAIKKNRIYIYDTEEDRNFLITDNTDMAINVNIRWFPTSNHILVSQKDNISIKEYDNTNEQILYTGSYVAPYAFTIGSTNRIIILTNLGGGTTSVNNLYSLTIR